MGMAGIFKSNIFVGITSACLAGTAVYYFCEERSRNLAREAALHSGFDRKIPEVYCTKDIALGTVISFDDVNTRLIEYSRYPANGFDCQAGVVGRKILRAKKKGQYIDHADFGIFRPVIMDSEVTLP